MEQDPKEPQEISDSDLESVAGGARKTGGGNDSGGGGGGGKGGGKNNDDGSTPIDGDAAIDDILNV